MNKRKQVACIMQAIIAAGAIFLCGCGNQTSQAAYEAGLSAVERAEYNVALQDFNTVIADEEMQAEGYRGKGIAYMGQKDYGNAVDSFEKSLRADLGEDVESGETDLLSDEMELNDFREDVLFYLADAYTNLGKEDSAMTIYDRLVSGSHAGDAYLLRGCLFVSREEYTAAEADFEKALNRDIDYEGYLLIYRSYVAKDRQADGTRYLNMALTKEPKDSEDYQLLGEICYAAGNYDLAKTYLSSAINEGSPEAISLLGRVCIESDDVARARQMFQEAIENDEMKALGYNGLGLCAMAEADYASAAEYFSKGIALKDSSVQEALLYNEIVAYEKMLDFETAKTKMTYFNERFPNNEAGIKEYLFLESR